MSGYEFHPEARSDLDEIWEFIRADNLDAADRVIAEILAAVRALIPIPHAGHRRPDLTGQPLRSSGSETTSLPTRRMKSRYGSSLFFMATAARAP